mmetsp:Transcript_17014/g.2812  ORF Transcript_17014/g.2812 Transcript_17014/m.2812 type:complete len:83 (+) Transcript_17014:577-825(+)
MSQQGSFSIVKLIKSPVLLMDLLAITFLCLIIGFNEAVAGKYLEEKGLDPSDIGFVFLIASGCYLINSVIVSKFGSKMNYKG